MPMLLGRASKLKRKQQFLNFIFFMKCDNVTIYNVFMWNWAKSSLCNHVLFITSCINNGLIDGIHWPMPHEKVVLDNQLCELLKCIRFIDKTIVEILMSWKDSKHHYGLMPRRKYMQWTTPLVWTIMDCLFTLTWVTLSLSMM
jgi:hypothetical protein